MGTAMFALYSSSRNKEASEFDQIPMPKGKYPYIGHLLNIGENSYLKLHEWHKELGPIIHVKMGVQDFIFISDPSIAHKVFSVNGAITTLRPPNKFSDDFYTMNGRGMAFSRNKKKLKEARFAVSGYLASKVVDQLGDKIRFETSYLIDRLITHGKSNEGIDPFNDLTFRSLNVITKVCLEIMYLTQFHTGIGENIDTFIPPLSFMNYIQDKNKRRKDYINLRNSVLRKLIIEALEGDEDCMVKNIKQLDKKNVYDKDDMLVIISDLIIGGTDTVSVVLSKALVFLSHYPDIQKKMYTEIDAFITKHKRLPNFTEREEFPYITSFQRELLRFYPTTMYGIPHMAEEDFVVNNYIIKKGTTLISDMYSMHRNPDVYPDPDKFIPERFINNKSTFHASATGKPTERDQFNFGWGRRMCPGIYLAEAELFLTYTTLLARCTIEPALDSSGSPVYGDIESSVDGGLVIRFKPYKLRFIERPDRLL
ncbi:cytochrome P450 [Spinellus fusiger]|nr:cytochrome P450 [Spinellus fusiger]